MLPMDNPTGAWSLSSCCSVKSTNCIVNRRFLRAAEVLDEPIGSDPVRANAVLDAGGELALDPNAKQHPGHPKTGGNHDPAQNIQERSQFRDIGKREMLIIIYFEAR